LFDDLYASLARVARATSGDGPSETLVVAVHEACALIGADLAVVRLPNGSFGPLEIRMPEGAPWPPTRLLLKWSADLAEKPCPIPLAERDRPRRPALLGGIVLPVFTPNGPMGVVGAFSSSRTGFSLEQCTVLALLVESALVHTEALRLQQHAEAITTVKVHDRVAREIHDGPLQTLSGVMLHLRSLMADAGRESHDPLRTLEGELDQATKQMRALIRTLRLARPLGSVEQRLRAALTRLEQARGLSWSLRWQEPAAALPTAVSDEVFKVINEALANVYRHSSAKRVGITSRVRGEMFEVIVRDDGIGFDVAEAFRQDIYRQSFGLINMQERVAALGGTLTLRSQAGRGTRVLIRFPLNQMESDKTA